MIRIFIIGKDDDFVEEMGHYLYLNLGHEFEVFAPCNSEDVPNNENLSIMMQKMTRSDVTVVDLNSCGQDELFEIGLAIGVSLNNSAGYVIGVGENEKMSKFISDSLLHVEKNVADIAEYIALYLV